MNGILKFNLPAEQEEWELHLNAYAMHALIDEFQSFLRNHYKYTEPKDRPKFDGIYEQWLSYRKAHDV